MSIEVKMPLFRKQSEKGKKRQERQEYLAQDNPEPTFDLSACEISHIPSGVFARCKILQKEALLLHDNWLGSISGGNFSDLITLRVLDVHNNEIKVIPEDIGILVNLQVLSLEGNKLKKIPDTIGDLRSLQTLNVKKNKISHLPDTMCELPCLRLLDISDNEVTSLPKRLCYIRTLETLVLDASRMKYPDKEICKKGTEDTMKFLCSANGLEYQPPSNFLLNILEPPKPVASSWSSNSLKAYQEEAKMMKSLEQYQDVVDKKREDRTYLEKMMREEQEVQAIMAAKVMSQKQNLVDAIAKDQERILDGLNQLSEKKGMEREMMFGELKEVEKSADELLVHLLDMTEKAKKTEELLDELEQERSVKDGLFEVRWEEFQTLRKQEVLRAMKWILQDDEGMEKLRQEYTIDKDNQNKRNLEQETLIAGDQVESCLYHRQAHQKVVMETLAEQEQLQKQAFEALLVAKDAKSNRINSQIKLIEEQLIQLTLVEQERKDARAEMELNLIADKRIALSAMLAQLLEERDMRQVEIKKRLHEMDGKCVCVFQRFGQTDYWLVQTYYWLVQYQRLMDKKPQRLIDSENALEVEVVKILRKSGADDYLPLFARHKITIETIVQLTEDDLKQVGVHEVGLRKSILRYTEEMRVENKLGGITPTVETPAKQVATSMEEPSSSTHVEPSAPEEPAAGAMFQRQKSIIARGMNSECSICLERESQVIFLNCGHICCCVMCCGPLTMCPLCRAPIVQKIKISQQT
ncbi:E3 ubiquitin-protein ligase LRSAM1-like [Haliotis rubra]|uniref:E3 ubiquitin-protein ligase LRSAM1-like n=1 Tax=Haliotis rubra TaxID=36100 RepID=UPI001EE55E36|nr:E3 ubiquitin-protein ligase LRSAM1-like [Haliotis rubra]XP_046547781.1 E3 ubiquitin-protein ligase LRSAM1-like [Haliotis rubra]